MINIKYLYLHHCPQHHLLLLGGPICKWGIQVSCASIEADTLCGICGYMESTCSLCIGKMKKAEYQLSHQLIIQLVRILDCIDI